VNQSCLLVRCDQRCLGVLSLTPLSRAGIDYYIPINSKLAARISSNQIPSNNEAGFDILTSLTFILCPCAGWRKSQRGIACMNFCPTQHRARHFEASIPNQHQHQHFISHSLPICDDSKFILISIRVARQINCGTD
jgi:hypothetical protein